MVVDLWAPWCGPCRTLGPILERCRGRDRRGGRAGQGQRGREPPGRRPAFQVQSIPAVFAMRDRKVVDSFVGALPEAQVGRVRRPPGPGADRGRPAGRRRATRRRCAGPSSSSPTTRAAVVAWPGSWSSGGRPAEALELWPGSPRRPIRRPGRRGPAGARSTSSLGRRRRRLLDALLDRVRGRRRPARSSSTCSRPSAPTTPAPPATARRSPPGCSDPAAGPAPCAACRSLGLRLGRRRTT